MWTPVSLSIKPLRLDKRAVMVLLLYVSSVFAAGAGVSDKLLAYVSGKYGQAAGNRVVEWQGLINANRDKSDQEKLALVNSFFNHIPFVDDKVHWGKNDYWATPLEMLVTNGGDCEDFSIAKYFTLKELGVPEERMLIAYVTSVRINQAHMVLLYYPTPEGEPLVLDNLVKEIKPAFERSDLVPVYSFNGKDLWLSKERSRGKRVGASDRISPWQDVTERMRRESAQ